MLSILDLLEHEHQVDEEHAHEIAEELDYITQTGRIRDAEMLGYMLRGFFVCQRRHIGWQNTTILPFARKSLSRDDLRAVYEAMCARDKENEGRRVLQRGLKSLSEMDQS